MGPSTARSLRTARKTACLAAFSPPPKDARDLGDRAALEVTEQDRGALRFRQIGDRVLRATPPSGASTLVDEGRPRSDRQRGSGRRNLPERVPTRASRRRRSRRWSMAALIVIRYSQVESSAFSSKRSRARQAWRKASWTASSAAAASSKTRNAARQSGLE